MKTQHSFESGKKTLLDEQIPHGHPELVNFSSTSEVFQAVFENSLYANRIGNSHGKTLEANERVCKIFGYSAEEMIQLSTKEIFDTTESNYAEYLTERESNGKARAEVTGIRKNGQRFLCKISSVIFTDDNGETRTINTIHDISKNILIQRMNHKII
jgi:PAS domain S-box-containing protein